MKNEIVKTDVNFDEVSKLNQFAREMSKSYRKAIDILENGNLSKYKEEDAKEYLEELQLVTEFIPASDKFMSNVKKRFKDLQANFTIQNFLTWHHIDSILITYFKNNERLEKIKSCAVTEVDHIFVDALEKLVTNTDLTVEQMRYAYFTHTIPKLLKHLYFYNKIEDEIIADYNIIHGSKNGMNKLSTETLFALLPITQNANPMLHFVLTHTVALRKTQYGALEMSPNERYGNILYNGLTGQYKDIEKGEVVIRAIENIDNEKEYFKDRTNAYQLLTCGEGIKYKGAYINDVLVGVIGYTPLNITNIHIDGNYRFKGISKKLINAALEECLILGIAPIGDSLDYVKKIGKYDKKRNQALITKETLNNNFEKRPLPSNFKIEEYKDSCKPLISDKFKKYFDENYKIKEIQTKIATVDDKLVGYIAYNKKEKKIALIEVNEEFQGMGIASKLLESVVDYNVWEAHIAVSGALFWFGRGLTKEGSVYICSSHKRLKQFAKQHNISDEPFPIMHII